MRDLGRLIWSVLLVLLRSRAALAARSEHKLALPLAEQIEKVGEARNDVMAQLLGRRLNGQTRCYLGEFVAAPALLEQCHSLDDPTHRAAGAGPPDDPYGVTLSCLALTLAYLGDIDQAKLRLNEALSEARRLRACPYASSRAHLRELDRVAHPLA